jgi:hypothetical protein
MVAKDPEIFPSDQLYPISSLVGNVALANAVIRMASRGGRKTVPTLSHQLRRSPSRCVSPLRRSYRKEQQNRDWAVRSETERDSANKSGSHLLHLRAWS